MRKILIMVITFSILLCQLTFAAKLDSDLVGAKIVSQYSKNTDFNRLNTVQIGQYHQKGSNINERQSIDWIVLAKQDGKALLMSKYTLDKIPYHNTKDFCNWENCYLRAWLNNDFYNYAFNNDEKALIVPTTNITTDKRVSETVTTVDNIFILSDDEFKQYFNCNEDEHCKTTASLFTEYALTKPIIYGNSICSYFLRSKRLEDESLGTKQNAKPFEYVDDVNDNEDGTFYMCCYPTWGGASSFLINGIRPAMWVKYDTNAKTTMRNILDTADELGITNDVIKEGVKTATDFIPMPKPVGAIKDKVIDVVGDKVIDAVRGE